MEQARLPRPAQAGKTVKGSPVRFVLAATAPGNLAERTSAPSTFLSRFTKVSFTGISCDRFRG